MTEGGAGPAEPLSLSAERSWHKANRPHKVAKGPYAGLYAQGPAADRAVLRLDLDAETGAVVHLGWDNEGGGRHSINLLGSPATLHLIGSDDAPLLEPTPRKINRHGVDRVRAHYAQCSVEWTLGKPKGGVRMVYEPRATQSDGLSLSIPISRDAAILGGQHDDTGTVRPPFLLHVPGHGPLLVKVSPRNDGYVQQTSTETGSRLTLFALPSAPGKPVTFTLQPVQLDVPADIPELLWPALRRCWLDALHPTSSVGEIDSGEPPPGLYMAPDTGEPSAAWLPLWADLLLATPMLPGGVELCDALRRTIDYLIDRRFPISTADPRIRLLRSAEQLEKLGNTSVWVSAHLDGVVPAYGDHIERLEGNTGVLIGAWAVWRLGRDAEWLKARWKTLERMGQYLERFDTDGDGLVETSDPAYAGDTSANADAAVNALVCRAWLCLGAMALAQKKRERAAYWFKRVENLRQSCRDAFRYPSSGEWARWRSADGVPSGEPAAWIAGLGVAFGLIRPADARTQLEHWWREGGGVIEAITSEERFAPEQLYGACVFCASLHAGLRTEAERALSSWLQQRWSSDPPAAFEAPFIYTLLLPSLPDTGR